MLKKKLDFYKWYRNWLFKTMKVYSVFLKNILKLKI